MARRFTAGVATGILIVGLAGVVIAATHTSSTSAASPSGTAIASRNGASQSTEQTTNQQWGAWGVARTALGQSSMSGDPGAGFMIVRKAGLLTVTAINGQTITATFGGGKGIKGGPFMLGKPGFSRASSSPVTLTIDVTSTTVYTRARHSASLADIHVGSVLSVQGTSTGINTITASAIEIVLPQRMGVVTAVNGNNLTVTGFDARTYTITVGGDTTYRRAGRTAALADVAVGSLISAEGTSSSDGSTLNALAVTIQLPRVAGQVTAVSGNTVTVQGPDGTTSTVQLTDTTTYSAKPQGTASKSSITTGSFIMAEGTLGSDGTLTALHVDVATGFDPGMGKGPGIYPGMGKGPGIGFAPPPGAEAISSPGSDATTSAGPSF
jgi:Domain of unknown function (DUF5666)